MPLFDYLKFKYDRLEGYKRLYKHKHCILFLTPNIITSHRGGCQALQFEILVSNCDVVKYLAYERGAAIDLKVADRFECYTGLYKHQHRLLLLTPNIITDSKRKSKRSANAQCGGNTLTHFFLLETIPKKNRCYMTNLL